MIVRFKQFGPVAMPLPRYAREDDAGMDLAALVRDGIDGLNAVGSRVVHRLTYGPLIVQPGESVVIPTGWGIQLPSGYEAQVRGRSGLSSRRILVPTGTIDAGYRGEIMATVINNSGIPFTIHHGDRIAQLVIAPVVKATVLQVDELDPSERGEGGHGSTGR